jgi:hypothetical protein
MQRVGNMMGGDAILSHTILFNEIDNFYKQTVIN